jgi:hypothetical protein
MMLSLNLIPDPGRPVKGRFLLLELGSLGSPKRKPPGPGGNLGGFIGCSLGNVKHRESELSINNLAKTIV